jgi:type III restriction enzyme
MKEKLKLKFDYNLPYQNDAINSITGIFEGQRNFISNFSIPNVNKDGNIGFKLTELGYANKLSLLPEEILGNVRNIQLKNGVKQSKNIESYNFSIEMETGTGKTYVYIRTIFELNRLYGFTKFIIVVPSIAIKEGTLKFLEITKEHIESFYDNVPYEYFTYNSSKLGQVRNFASSSNIEIMVINIDAFRKGFDDPEKEIRANIIHRQNDKLSGFRPIDFIQQTNPILIIDEPQSVDTTQKSKEAIKSLNPLFSLRYSATHKNLYNLMYKFDSIDAYEQKWVKQIEVAEITTENYQNYAYIKLIKTDNKKSPITATVEIDISSKGSTQRVKKTLKQGDDLYEISGGRNVYEGYIINDIYCEEGNEYIDFTSNNKIVRKGETIGSVDSDILKRLQIKKTIEEHLNKELILNPKGYKVLSLFFIDRVSNYRLYDAEGNEENGKYADMFEEEYKEIIKKPKFQSLLKEIKDENIYVKNIHNGYFSIDKVSKKSNKEDKFERFKDTSGNIKADEDTFNLIMKDKEKLLSFDSELRFIFSHSALKEGWDNPNVFQICTLNDTSSEMKKRQEIGRGLRLAVDQKGDRARDFDINTLTVMANESYEEFVKKLQKETEEDTGIKFGVIDDHTFANIVIARNDNKDEYFGQYKSEQLYKFFKEKGYIDYNSKITELLNIDINDNKIDIPQKYIENSSQIIKILKKISGNINIRRANEKKQLQINKKVFLSPEFKELWDKIKYKTLYSVNFDSEELINKCAKEIETRLNVGKSRFNYKKGEIEITKGGMLTKKINENTYLIEDSYYELPDIITFIQNETNLTRKSIVDILIKSNKFHEFKNNPQKFIDECIKIILQEMGKSIIDGIKYEKIGENAYYRQELFRDEEIFGYININLIESFRSPYDYILYDSDIEKKLVKEFENQEFVKVYAKLPSWFKIETPIGNYNPDWAVLVEKDDEQTLYFVLESKGTLSLDMLRDTEKNKIECGIKHFEALNTKIKFEVVSNIENFRDYIT